MKLSSKTPRAVLVSGLIACGALIGPAAAMAVSTTVSPAGHTLRIDPHSVSFGIANLGESTCTMNASTAVIPSAPANHNGSGGIGMPFSIRPTFSSCTVTGGTLPTPVTTSGNWTIMLTGTNPATATVYVPAGGFTYRFDWPAPYGCSSTNTSAFTLTGTWTNGTLVPFSKSKIANQSLTASVPMQRVSGPYPPSNLCVGNMYGWYTNASPLAVGDLTAPASLITVTP